MIARKFKESKLPQFHGELECAHNKRIELTRYARHFLYGVRCTLLVQRALLLKSVELNQKSTI